jgi:hypothetical protein
MRLHACMWDFEGRVAFPGVLPVKASFVYLRWLSENTGKTRAWDLPWHDTKRSQNG